MANYYDPKAYAKLPGRSKFDLSYRNSFTAKMGQLIPVTVERVIPGDRFRYGLTYQMQLSPMINPVYDGLEVNFEAFFVPNRILDKRWREFWTGYNEYDQTTPVDIAPLTMQVELVSSGSITQRYVNPALGCGSLLDFLGYQFKDYDVYGNPSLAEDYARTYAINALPILAYNRIYDDWYRNERTQKAQLYDYYNNASSSQRFFLTSYNAEAGEDFVLDNGENYIPAVLLNRNYKKDRFTTALPEPIIGGDVRIPTGNEDFSSFVGADGEGVISVNDQNTSFSLSALALGTIQQLKLALKEYQYKMKDTYNGNRYVENLYAHYGVVVPDSTLQRAIYLGSARDYVNFGEVYQTSGGSGESDSGALGDFAGRGAANGTHYMFDESFYEPGYFICLCSIVPRSRYFQGIKRDLIRFDRADYFSPEYQNIGDDFITTVELYNDNEIAQDFETAPGRVFGYNSRWIEYKSRYDELHGTFANPSSPMFNWNFARFFANTPVISPEFSATTQINKPFATLDNFIDNFNIDIAVSWDALRPILATESF